ncbi:cytochrome P450 [Gautieria morchelliformis]|nr:cytochrome P450 [Gautieria morchelliformis]
MPACVKWLLNALAIEIQYLTIKCTHIIVTRGEYPAWTSNIYIALGGLICATLFLLVVERNHIPKGAHLPPGPPGKAIIGNVYDAPKEHQWRTYTNWAKQYGDLVYIKIFRQPIVIVNSLAVAHDLFEKRSSVYSDRFEFPMVNDLAGFDWNLATMRYGDKWRRHRKMFHQSFHLTAVTAYTSIQEKRTKELLYRLRKSPDNFLEHIRHLSGATIMEITYGIDVLPSGDPYIQLAEQATEASESALIPGSFLVDILPILKYVPEWMPGAGFKTKARIWRQVVTRLPFVPFNACKKALTQGKATPSVTASLLESMADLPETNVPQQEETIRNTGAVAYLAGADTTAIALSWFILAMILYPDVQRKAQRELDEVMGADRLPTFDDRDSLPYMNAVCKEIQRWRPAAPLGIPHRLMEDDVYNNNFIPRGSVIMGNTWAMLHDETVYGPDTEHFEPERFLRPGTRDPSAAFGFGRRICPGRYLADNTIYLAACCILKVFNISPAKDANGAEIPVHDSISSGAISRPEPFSCSIKPRTMIPEKFFGRKGIN